MERQNYILEYTCYDVFGVVIEKKKVRAKMKLSELHAKSGLEDHLKSIHKNFGKLIVTNCYPDTFFGNLFGEAFKENPFDQFKKK